MRTALDNLPLIDHQNLIGVPDRFEPVCNHNYGFLARQLADCLHQLLLVFRVHIRGRLVQDDHGPSFMMARAMESRWRSPPESVPPPSPSTVSYPCGSIVINSWQRAFFAASILTNGTQKRKRRSSPSGPLRRLI